MYLYNISIIIDQSETTNFLPWLKDYLQTFESNAISFLKMHNAQHEGETFCLHLRTDSTDAIETFKIECVSPIQSYIQEKFHGKVFIFDSLMEHLPLSSNKN